MMAGALPLPSLPVTLIDEAIARALAEDFGEVGDITTNATIAADTRADAVIAARAEGRVAGLDLAKAAFLRLDPQMEFDILVADGMDVDAGGTVARLEGKARALLSAERVALNFLGHMSGIATMTRDMVRLIDGTGATICDTRKTTPGLRALEKYAVRAGGGGNHRFGLFDAVLIKDNHIHAAGGVRDAISAARSQAGHMVKIEVEVDTLDQLREVLEIGADVVLLDNMPPATLREAVRLIDGRALAEASGGVHHDTVAAIAASGVDMISVGALTHSAPVLDLGLDFT